MQWEILNSTKKYQIGLFGRGWGKTFLALEILRKYKDAVYVAPDYGMMQSAKRQFEAPVKERFQTPNANKHFLNGFVILDETAFMHTEFVLDVFSRAERVICLSTPKYQDWYNKFFLANLFNSDAECYWQTSYENPMLEGSLGLMSGNAYENEILAWLS